MIERYTRKPMGDLWAQERRFEKMKEVEVAVAQVQAELGMIPKAAAKDIKLKSKFSVKRILKIEETTKHDVIAFVSNMAENVGDNGRFIHFGMTSSDVLDTALSLQIKEAGELIQKGLQGLRTSLVKQAKAHAETLCSGRTHGMHAEPTSFGLKLSGFICELDRNAERFNRSLQQISIGKISGAVGTYSAMPEKVEKGVCQLLGLKQEKVATQVIPRDRHAEVIVALSMIGNMLERLSVELRHLQRTEVAEVFEGFSKGQKGSSAMPHKKNPISAENITGASRLLRSYALSALENVALWHERDISHSSVERVIFPDAFILCDYALHRMAGVIDNLEVDKDRMIFNMNQSQGQLFSSHLLLELVKKAGWSREQAYAKVQSLSHSLKPGEHLKDKAALDPEITKYISKKEIESVFAGKAHKAAIKKLVSKVVK